MISHILYIFVAEGSSFVFSITRKPGLERGAGGWQAHLGWMVVWMLLLSSRAAEERGGWMGGKRSSGGKDT